MRAYWPGATAQQVADQVTDKLERTLQEVPYADKIRSYSKPGETLIIFQVKDSSPPKELQQVWYQTRKKINDIRGTLPAGVIGPFFNDEFGDVYGSMFALAGEGFSPQELKGRADVIRQRLLKVQHVSKVEIFGAQDEKLYIEVSQKRLAQLGLDFNAVLAQLGQQNAVESAGGAEGRHRRRAGACHGAVQFGGSLAGVPDPRWHGQHAPGGHRHHQARLIDPAQVTIRHQGQDALVLGIAMAKGGDILELGKSLAEANEEVRAQLPAAWRGRSSRTRPRWCPSRWANLWGC